MTYWISFPVWQRPGSAGSGGTLTNIGQFVIPPRFDEAGDFTGELAPVRVDRKWGYIDKSGRIVVEPHFDGAVELKEGMGRVSVCEPFPISERHAEQSGEFWSPCGGVGHERIGFVDHTGTLVIQPSFDEAGEFSNGLAAARRGKFGQSKFGFIDRSGHLAIPAQFDYGRSFSEGLAPVMIGRFDGMSIWGLWEYIDTSGAAVITPKFCTVDGFSDGLAGVRLNRKALAPASWARWPFSDGLTIVGETGSRVYIDNRGNVIAPYERDIRQP
jgi:hypothetical protein